MKYTEKISGKKPKFGTGFYVTAALCLLIVGGASWFALSNYSSDGEPINSGSSASEEYSDGASSYIESGTEKAKNEVSEKKEQLESFVSEQIKPQSNENTAQDGEAVSAKEKVKVFTMPVQGEVLKPYSDTQLQYSETLGDMRLHGGIDIACDNGTAVSACSDGTVVSVELNTSLGNTVSIDHGDGLTVKYASLDDIKIKLGDKLAAGDIIGSTASVPSECADREHLHLEVYLNGTAVSPLEALNLG